MFLTALLPGFSNYPINKYYLFLCTLQLVFPLKLRQHVELKPFFCFPQQQITVIMSKGLWFTIMRKCKMQNRIGTAVLCSCTFSFLQQKQAFFPTVLCGYRYRTSKAEQKRWDWVWDWFSQCKRKIRPVYPWPLPLNNALKIKAI